MTQKHKQSKNFMPSDQAKIILIDAISHRRSILRRALNDFGYQIVAELHNCQNLSAQVEAVTPDIIVIGTDIPDEQTLEQLVKLHAISPYPIIMFAEKHTPETIESSVSAGVSAYIVDDIQPQRLKSIIEVAYARFQNYQALRQELVETKTELENRKILEKAKGILMEQKNLNEQQAFKALRKMAMDKGQTMAAISKSVIDVWELLATN
ncbi:ANTAR domain-containing response regulator [Thalassotalea sp. PLHSN55]|uniref:ANTAR domain-containing response regulator n=1 Tax=Thalassotalea sp. PLHSN55 TaxID=3435888 RepID=UPI003F85D6C2